MNEIPTRESRLDQIASKIHAALGREIKSIIEIGKLLIESKDELEYGEWLPWLEENFDLSQRSAYRYIAAARYAESIETRFATVANLEKHQISKSWLLAYSTFWQKGSLAMKQK